MNTNAIIKPLSTPDLKTLLQWTTTEGWTPGTYDIQAYYQGNPEGLLGIYLEDELIGSSMVYRHNPWFAFFGLYIVRPENREQGFGIEMTRHRLQLAGYRNIGLDGVLDRIDTYQNVGFRRAYLNQRFAFSVSNIDEPVGLHDASKLSLSSLLDFERKHKLFPGDRKLFLQHWLGHPKFISRAVIENGEIQGYMVLRPCEGKMRVGPFLATSEATAHKLLLCALHHSKGQEIYIDMPETNPHISHIIDEFNGNLVFETVRMYRGYQPDLQFPAIYGLTTLEAG